MIPELNCEGLLPPGRYRCSVEELHERFVAHPSFRKSDKRAQLFEGFVKYLIDWEDAAKQTKAERPFLRAVWVAGSFTTSEQSPSDIDISPIVDGSVADEVARRPGSRMIRKLTQHRDSIKERYGVEVFPIRWFPIERPFMSGLDLSGDQRAYLSDRGKMDDWWQRCRVDESDVPSVASCETRRGYLEVIVDESA
ncbi:DUF6932 family protein [Rhodococcus aetherivorans]|uniref:DUF6932 family protein n=1 Tax=Rhodococcus aetherivorans TaxID=191292 RepID=UPI00388EC09D